MDILMKIFYYYKLYNLIIYIIKNPGVIKKYTWNLKFDVLYNNNSSSSSRNIFDFLQKCSLKCT